MFAALSLSLALFAPPGPVLTDAGGRATVVVDGVPRDLVVEPALQRRLQALVDRALPRRGAVVLVDVATGDVVALAEHDEADPDHGSVGLRPLARAASVFKVVTTSALLRADVAVDEVVCTSGGRTRISLRDLVDDPRRDRRCVRVEDVLPWSQNVAMAKLAGRFLTPSMLAMEAERYGIVVPDGDSARDGVWGDEPPPAHEAVPSSFAVIPADDTFGFATTAAGFGEVRLSGLDGARLARAVATGRTAPLRLFADDDADGATLAHGRVVLEAEDLRSLQAMMFATTTRGTAARGLHGPVRRPRPLRGEPWDVDVTVAAKTGSLTDRDVHEDTSWLVGWFPVEDPTYAFAVVVINDEWVWHTRAVDLARAAIATVLVEHPELRAPRVASAAGTPAGVVPR